MLFFREVTGRDNYTAISFGFGDTFEYSKMTHSGWVFPVLPIPYTHLANPDELGKHSARQADTFAPLFDVNGILFHGRTIKYFGLIGQCQNKV